MRGEIQYRERAKQIINMSGLRFPRGITPTDVDGAVEFDDKLFIWFEAKLEGADLPYGQRLYLERVCNAVAESGRVAVVLVIEHNTKSNEDIDAATCLVRERFYHGKWKPPENTVTCREAMDILYQFAGLV